MAQTASVLSPNNTLNRDVLSRLIRVTRSHGVYSITSGMKEVVGKFGYTKEYLWQALFSVNESG